MQNAKENTQHAWLLEKPDCKQNYKFSESDAISIEISTYVFFGRQTDKKG